MAEIVVIASAKGPTGKTFFASHLALALSRVGHNSVILDLNGSRHAVANFFGVPIPHDLNDVAWGRCAPEAVFIPAVEQVDLVALGDPTGWNDAEMMSRVLALVPMFETREFIIVDVPRRNSTCMVAAVRAASAIFAIVTPEQVANGEAHCNIQQLHRHACATCINIVLNRVISEEVAEVICGRLEHDCGRILGVRARCVACIPELPQSAEGEPLGSPVIRSSLDSTVARLMLRLVERLCSPAAKTHASDNIQGFIEALFQAHPEDVALPLWLPEPRDLLAEPSAGLEKEALLLRDIIEDALDNRDMDSRDLADIYRLIRQAIEPSAKGRTGVGATTAS